MAAEEVTLQKVEEALKRLTAAHEGGFGWNVMRHLIAEVVMATAQNQIALGKHLLQLGDEMHSNMEDLKRKIEATIK